MYRRIYFLQVEPIVDGVKNRGDAAVRELTAKFDKVEIKDVCVPIGSLPDPVLPADVQQAFDTAFNNIKAFHEAQINGSSTDVVEKIGRAHV